MKFKRIPAKSKARKTRDMLQSPSTALPNKLFGFSAADLTTAPMNPIPITTDVASSASMKKCATPCKVKGFAKRCTAHMIKVPMAANRTAIKAETPAVMPNIKVFS